MLEERRGSLSGLTEQEAKEFHGIFITSFIVFTVIADRCSLPGLELAALAVALRQPRVFMIGVTSHTAPCRWACCEER